MNQSEVIEKVAQATELNQAAAGQAVKAVVNAIIGGNSVALTGSATSAPAACVPLLRLRGTALRGELGTRRAGAHRQRPCRAIGAG